MGHGVGKRDHRATEFFKRWAWCLSALAGLAASGFDRGSDRCFVTAQLRQQALVAPHRRVTVRMLVAGVAQKAEEDYQMPAHQRFRLLQAVGGLEQTGEVFGR